MELRGRMMVWQPERLTVAQMEERRLAAGRLLRAGKLSEAEIARQMGVSRTSVARWKRSLARGGTRALRRRRHPGRPSRLTAAEWRQLLRILRRGEVSSVAALRAPLDGPPQLYARHFRDAIRGEQVIVALRYFRRRIGRPLTIIWDGLPAHRAKAVQEFLAAHPDDYHIEWLPA